jgi:hypothetical protein
MVGETRKGDPAPPKPDHHGSRPEEDVEVRVSLKEGPGNPGTFMITGNQEDGNTGPGNLQQGSHGFAGHGGRRPRPVEEIAAMDHGIDPSSFRSPESLFEIRLEIVPSPTPLDSGPLGKIEAQVGIGQEKDLEGHDGFGNGPALELL